MTLLPAVDYLFAHAQMGMWGDACTTGHARREDLRIAIRCRLPFVMFRDQSQRPCRGHIVLRGCSLYSTWDTVAIISCIPLTMAPAMTMPILLSDDAIHSDFRWRS